MSSSVVDQLETETRMAARPCQTVPPSHASPPRWTSSTTFARRRVVVVEAQQHLVEHHVVEHLDAVDLAHRIGQPARQRAVALDQLGQARRGPSERSAA